MFFSTGFLLFSNLFQFILIKENFFLEYFFISFKTKCFIFEKKKISSKILNLFFLPQKIFVLTIKNKVYKKGLKKIKSPTFHKNKTSHEKEYFTKIKKKILSTRIKRLPSYNYFLFLCLNTISIKNIIIKEMLFGINEDIYENNSKFLENERRQFLSRNRLKIQFLNQFVYNLKKIYFLIHFAKISNFYKVKSPKKIIFSLFPILLPLYGLAKKKRTLSKIKKLVSDKTLFCYVNILKEISRYSIFKKICHQKFFLLSKKNSPLYFKNKLLLLKYLKRVAKFNGIQFKQSLRKIPETKKNFLFFNFIHKSFFQLKIYLFEAKIKKKYLFFSFQKLYFSKFIYKILNRGIISLIFFTILNFGKILFFLGTLFYEFLQNFDRFQHKNFISKLRRKLSLDNWENDLTLYFLSSSSLPIKKLFFTIQVRKNVLKYPKNFYIFFKKITNKNFYVLYALVKGIINFSFFKFCRSFDQIAWINISNLSINSYTKYNFFTFIVYIVVKFIKTWNKCKATNFRDNLFSLHSGCKKLLLVFKILLKLQKISYGDLNHGKNKNFIFGHFINNKALILNLFVSSPEYFEKIDSTKKSKLYFVDFFLYLSSVKIILVYKKTKKSIHHKNLIIIKITFRYRNAWKKTKKNNFSYFYNFSQTFLKR